MYHEADPEVQKRLMLEIKKQLTEHILMMLESTETSIPQMIFDVALTFGGQTFILPLNVELVEDFGKLLDRQMFVYDK
jgi:hypothetical protein